LGAPHLLLCAVCFTVCLALLARLVAASTVEAEGSGFPEMKAVLSHGKHCETMDFDGVFHGVFYETRRNLSLGILGFFLLKP
jgi:H+/Cl- antiporter ClcA